MENEFVTYEQAVALKELGFDEPCFGYYKYKLIIEGTYKNSEHGFSISIPLYQQAFRWFREKYNLHGCVDLHVSNPTHWYIRIDNIVENDYLYHSEDENLQFKTYEEAESACLDKLIEIVKNK